MKTRKILSIALVLVTILSSLSVFATGAFAAADVWDGKSANIKWYADDPSATEFTISTAADLYGLSVLCYSKTAAASVKGDTKIYYEANGNVIFDAANITETTASVAFDQFQDNTIKLAADIDLNGKPFVPIGNSGSFQGMFDGQNHTISNVTIETEDALHKDPNISGQYFYGLFAFLARNGSGVKNLTIKNEVLNVKVPETAKKIWVGGVTATSNANEQQTLTNVKVEGLTVNLSTSATFTKLEFYLGAIYGVYKSTSEQSNVVVTDYSVNGLEDLKAAATTFTAPTREDMFYAAGAGTGAFTNCSVSLKQTSTDTDANTGAGTGADTGDNSNQGTNPDTSDTTVAIAVAAILSFAVVAVVATKKRTN